MKHSNQLSKITRSTGNHTKQKEKENNETTSNDKKKETKNSKHHQNVITLYIDHYSNTFCSFTFTGYMTGVSISFRL